jgi:sugar phosphate permease
VATTVKIYYKKFIAWRFFPYFVCALAAMFYLYEFIIRVAPSVMTTQLMASFHIQSFALGSLAACFFYVYAPMQIPAGLIIDRFGPRILLSTMMLLCAIAGALFASTTNVYIAGFARALIGFGSSFAFISILVLISRWCPPKQFAMLTGITQLLGAVGAIAGEKPLNWAIAHFSWQSTLLFIAAIGLLLALLMWAFIHDHPPGKAPPKQKNTTGKKQWHHELGRLKQVLARKQTWVIAICGFASWTAIATFATLWGVRYLEAVYHFLPENASAMVSIAWVGVAVGSPFLGWWSDRLSSRKTPLLVGFGLGLLGTGLLFYIPHLSTGVIAACLFLLGVSSGTQAVAFGLVKDINPASTMGTATGFNNMAVIIGAAIFQPLVGHLLQVHWQGVMRHGVPVYSANNYYHALLILPLTYVLGLVAVAFFIKETHCQSQTEQHHYHL